MWRCAVVCGALLAACGRVDFDPLATGDAMPVPDGPVPAPMETTIPAAAAIAVDDVDSCTITLAGALWCWGGNYAGELGTGDLNPVMLPEQIESTHTWRRVAQGVDYTIVLDDHGAVFSTGNDGDTELGLGDFNNRDTFSQLELPDHIVAISTLYDTTLALGAGGTRWAWGHNNAGDAGIGVDDNDLLVPLAAAGATDWIQATIGDGVGCGIRADKSLWCWGTPAGVGDAMEYLSPQPVMAGTTWQQVAAGIDHVCAIDSANDLWCWGDNAHGELGEGVTSTTVLAPVKIVTATKWASVVGGLEATCAIDTTGGLWCWGIDVNGILGLGGGGDTKAPAQVLPGTQWSAVSLDWFDTHTCGVQQDGSVWCWGAGAGYTLGQGDQTNHPSPVQVTLQ